MAIQPFGVKVREKKETPKKKKLTPNQIITILLSIVLIVITVCSAWVNINLLNENTNLQKANFDLQNYPIKVFEYPIEAVVEGGYVNHTTDRTESGGFLNATIIISTPDIARLIIENCSLTSNYNGKFELVVLSILTIQNMAIGQSILELILVHVFNGMNITILPITQVK